MGWEHDIKKKKKIVTEVENFANGTGGAGALPSAHLSKIPLT